LEYAVANESGINMIAGIDEAGRGAIAGPVFAAAVILPLDDQDKINNLRDVDDSKKKTAKQREELFDLVVANSLSFGVGSSPASIIDCEGIISANAIAMMEAVENLDLRVQFLLIDGRMRLKNLALPQQSIIKGDCISLSIAAASILAKVSRDRHMISLGSRFPGYGLERNKGYCTREHAASLDELGPSSIHRYSFAPIRLSLL
jgi:ribonuclease HII